MVFNYKNGVQVFGMNNASTKLVKKHIFYFDDSEKLPGYSIEVAKEMFKLDTTDGASGFSIAIVGQILMGVAKSGKGHSRLHVWDLESGEKLKEEVSPIEDTRIISVKRYETSEDVIVVCETIKSEGDMLQELDEKYLCCIYSPEKLKFYPYITTDLTKGMICGMNGRRLLLYDGEKLTVVDYRKPNEIFTESLSGISEIHGTEIGIVFRYHRRRQEIHVFNTFTFKFQIFHHPYLIYLEPLCGNFLLMNFGNHLFPSAIWEIGVGFVQTEQLPLGKNAVKANKTCTRIVYKKNEIQGLYTFREGCYW
ncbi:hypothetical protein J6590_000678 [Homalodisca vitripennis]|nr:hypothetical protein J6590_000678 [Homalodisca vitripennis]